MRDPDHFEIRDGVFQARDERYILEWSLEDGSLTRAATVPLGELKDPLPDTGPCGGKVGERVLPVSTLWSALTGSIWGEKTLPDGRIFFSQGGTHIGISSIERVRYLEIPLHAALGALLVAVIFVLWRRRSPIRTE